MDLEADMAAFLAQMGEGGGVRLHDRADGQVEMATFEDFLPQLQQFDEAPMLLNVVGLCGRSVTTRFSSTLEHDFFTETHKQELCISYYRWEKLVWVILTMPKQRLRWCQQCAKMIGARVDEQAMHVLVGGDGPVDPAANARLPLELGLMMAGMPVASFPMKNAWSLGSAEASVEFGGTCFKRP